jgi:hypothetical protein
MAFTIPVATTTSNTTDFTTRTVIKLKATGFTKMIC